MKTFAWLALGLVLLVAWPAAAVADETSVRPGVNRRFTSPDLDVERWAKTFETESREIFARRRGIVSALGLKPGMAMADVGAGTGVFMELFAEGVGVDGRLYATEISPKFLEHLRERARRGELENVAVVEGGDRKAGLPDASVDLIFLCDVYHHFEYPQTMLASLFRALRPGGRLVVVDFEKIPGQSREWVLGHVRGGKRVTTAEIANAGFAFERELEIEGLVENYALEFRRP